MSSQFLTFIFIILISVQLSSCRFFPFFGGKDSTEESSTAAIEADHSNLPDGHKPTDSLNSGGDADSGDDFLIKSSTSTPASVKNETEPENYEPTHEEKPLLIVRKSKSYVKENYMKNIDPIVTSTPSVNSESTSDDDSDEKEFYTNDKPIDVKDKAPVPRDVNEEDRDDYFISSTSTPASFKNENEPGNFTENTIPEIAYTPSLKNESSSDDDKKESYTEKPIDVKDKAPVPRDVNEEDGDYSMSSTVTPDSFKNENEPGNFTENTIPEITYKPNLKNESSSDDDKEESYTEKPIDRKDKAPVPRNINETVTQKYDEIESEPETDLNQSESMQTNATVKTIVSTTTDIVMNTTEMAGSMSNVTTPEVNFGSFVNSGSTSNTFSQLIINLCTLIFAISVIV